MWKVALLCCMALYIKLHLKPCWSQQQTNACFPREKTFFTFFFPQSRHHHYSFEDYSSTDLQRYTQVEQSSYTPKHKSSHVQTAKEENLPVMVRMSSHPFQKAT